MTSLHHFPPGAVFGRDFRIVRPLRAGGMGAVYVVDQLSTGKQRALKVMAPELAMDPATRERFVLEAKAAAKIESDHVVEIVTAGVDEQTGAPYLVMELLKGEELSDAIQRTGALPIGDVAEVLSQIGHALEQAHGNGIVHRDLKPENVFLAASKRRDAAFTAKILDFGIAKLVADSQKTGTQPLGTPLFMAPEQTDRKGKISPATDVWALGLMAFLLLTGKDYWREADGSLPMLLREVCIDELPPASVRAAELGVAHLLPQGFDPWFGGCVRREVDERFPDAGAAVRAFMTLVPPDSTPSVLTVSQSLAAQPASLMRPDAKISTDPDAETNAPTIASDAITGSLVAARTAQSGVAMTQTTGSPSALAVPKREGGSMKLVLMAIGALVLGGGAAIVYSMRGGEGAAPAAPTATSTAAAPPPETSSSAAVAPAGTCPDDMVLHPAGKMIMGALDTTEDAKVTHKVTLSAFCLDKTEVTVAAYDACVAALECTKTPNDVSWPNVTPEQKQKFSPLCNARREGRQDHPINCIQWSMAVDYCKWKDRRLPSEAEWEYAARGSTQRDFPWGDQPPDETRLNGCGAECAAWATEHGMTLETMYPGDDGFPATAPVGSFVKGASDRGVLDLAGNVWEWTADWYAEYTPEDQVDPTGAKEGTQRVARGGAFNGSMVAWAKPSWRWKSDPGTYNHAIGFRCAKSAGAP